MKKDEAIMSGLFPVLLNVDDKLCIVVGGGDVAFRKVSTLVERGARVRVISPEVVAGIRELTDKGVVELAAREYKDGDLEGAFICVAAADVSKVNEAVRDEARSRGVLANVADDPEGSDFQVPSFFTDGALLLALSTQGSSPAVARTLRRMIQSYLGDSFGEALDIIGGFRERVKSEIKNSKTRVRFWEEAITPEVLDKVREGDLAGMERMLEDALASFKQGGSMEGRL